MSIVRCEHCGADIDTDFKSEEECCPTKSAPADKLILTHKITGEQIVYVESNASPEAPQPTTGRANVETN